MCLRGHSSLLLWQPEPALRDATCLILFRIDLGGRLCAFIIRNYFRHSLARRQSTAIHHELICAANWPAEISGGAVVDADSSR